MKPFRAGLANFTAVTLCSAPKKRPANFFSILGCVLTVLVASLLFVGCDQFRKTDTVVTGQLFIATKGGATITLGARPVLAVPTEKSKEVADKLRKEFAEQTADLAQAKTKRDNLKVLIGAIQNEMDATNAVLLSLKSKLAGEVPVENRDAHEASLAKHQTALEALRKEEDLAQRLIRSLGEKPEFKTRLLTAQNNILQAQAALDLAEKSYTKAKAQAAIEAEEQQARLNQQIEMVQQAAFAISGRKRIMEDDLARLTGTGSLASSISVKIGRLTDALTQDSISTITDANGEFELTIPTKGSFLLLAWADRFTMDETETYIWVVPLPSASKLPKKLLLANHNCCHDFDVALRAMSSASP